MSALTYAVLMAFALVILYALKRAKRPIDHDPGPAPGQTYPLWDTWSKWHLIGSALLGLVSCWLGVGPVWALGITMAGGLGWETIHGYVDRGDLLWDLVGTLGGIGVCLAL